MDDDSSGVLERTGVLGNRSVLDPKAKPRERPREGRGGMLGKEGCEKENYFLLRDLELSEDITSQLGCRRKKTIVEEGLCRVERGNSSRVHEISKGLYTLPNM